MKLLFVTPDLNENSLGRTYCLWLLAQHLGWDSTIVSFSGDRIWKPLEGTVFAESCRRLEGNTDRERVEALRSEVDRSDLIVAVKPLPGSFPVALLAADEYQKPLLLDIDDPDLEAWLRFDATPRAVARRVIRHKRHASMVHISKSLSGVPVMVSNPFLQSRYGGALIPHARPEVDSLHFNRTSRPRVTFVGTNRRHKGVPTLRAAIARLQGLGFTLTVTDTAPRDAKPWETWTGLVSMEEGSRLVRDADIVALPSLKTRFSEGQLPAKLIDAMMQGKPVVASDVDPLPWALGEGGLVVPAGSVSQLADALRTLTSADERIRRGTLLNQRAKMAFSVTALAPTFELCCLDAISLNRDPQDP